MVLKFNKKKCHKNKCRMGKIPWDIMPLKQLSLEETNSTKLNPITHLCCLFIDGFQASQIMS